MASSADPKFIVLLACEPSADALGAALARAWQTADSEVKLVGMAGPLMRAAGVQALWLMESVSVMGLWEVLKHYPRLKRLQQSMIAELLALKPDMVLGIDGPDFNIPIESAMKAAQIPAYHWVAPTVWAWRPKRAQRIAQQTDGLLCLFPFEPPYFTIHGLDAAFVGHPLADRLPQQGNRVAVRQALGWSAEEPVLALLPGSRRSEWHYHAPLFWQTVRQLRECHPKLRFVVPCLHERMQQALAASTGDLSIEWVIAAEGASKVLQAADVALVASGTATLETALCHTPMVVAYRMHSLSFWIMNRLRQTPWVSLPNILTNRPLVAEYLQRQATPDNLCQAIDRLLTDAVARETQLAAFELLHQQLAKNAALQAQATLVSWWQEHAHV